MLRAPQGRMGQTRQAQVLGMGRNPSLPPLLGVSGGQFGQMQMGQVSGPSLEEVLSQRGFKVPEMKTGVEASIHLMYKDPLTGEMTGGGPHAASHANAMSKFYEQNPEALKIAKQHKKDQQYKPGGFGNLHQGPPKPPQEIIPQSNDYLAGIRAENKTRQDKINSGELVRDPNQRDRGPPRYITKAEADALRPISVTGELTPPTPTPLFKESPLVGDQTITPPPREEPVFGGQTGGGIGGLQQFMQIMQMIMQMVQQSQGMGMGGMGVGMGMGMGGMRRNNFAPPQRFGGFNQYQSQQQYRPQFQQNFNNPYGPY